jgi:hypothetical protein
LEFTIGQTPQILDRKEICQNLLRDLGITLMDMGQQSSELARCIDVGENGNRHVQLWTSRFPAQLCIQTDQQVSLF